MLIGKDTSGPKKIYWFYMKDDKVNGPVPENELKEMFKNGTLKPETLVKSVLINWTQAKNTELIRLQGTQPTGIPYHDNIFLKIHEKEKTAVEENSASLVQSLVGFWTLLLNYIKRIFGK